ncbi:MAG: erythrose-4-phosphate dehydrogenase [Rhodocyclaceae bacterium]|nr:erythrose-4-phosphate dehydrogenase [Rhodocyclaceae bacterium]
MSLRIAINGYGRIGRCFLRAFHEAGAPGDIAIVAINEPAADLAAMAYLTRFDSTHGRFPLPVEAGKACLRVGPCDIPVFHGETPAEVPWRDLDVDILLDCSGRYSRRDELEAFIEAGCRRVLLSNPGHGAEDVDATIVVGANEQLLTGRERIVSAASCTTNAIVPILQLLERRYGLEQVLTTTLHSVMNDQPLIDGYHHADLRRTRSAMQSMIPVATGLARGIERLLPELAGRVQARAVRVPVANVSAIDLVATLASPAGAADINALMARAAAERPQLLAYSDEPHASIDFNHSPQSAIVDGGQTRTGGARVAGLLLWFDNEWGFVNRMLDLLRLWPPRELPAGPV